MHSHVPSRGREEAIMAKLHSRNRKELHRVYKEDRIYCLMSDDKILKKVRHESWKVAKLIPGINALNFVEEMKERGFVELPVGANMPTEKKSSQPSYVRSEKWPYVKRVDGPPPSKPTDELLIQLEEVHKILEDPSKTRWRASSEASEKLQLIIDKRKAG